MREDCLRAEEEEQRCGGGRQSVHATSEDRDCVTGVVGGYCENRDQFLWRRWSSVWLAYQKERRERVG